MASLEEPILDGIKHVNFFNGRLLTAEVFKADQEAQKLQVSRIGKALGPGIVSGLEVSVKTQSPAVVRVSPGCAINRRGYVMELSDGQDIELTAHNSDGESRGARVGGLFSDCAPDSPGPSAGGTTPGLYLLAARPVSGFTGFAPKNESPCGSGFINSCGEAFEIEGIQFRLVDLSELDLGSASEAVGNPCLFRNILAYEFLGVHEWKAFADWPFPTAIEATSLMSQLYEEALLGDCEAPLALVFLNDSLDLDWIDMWAVRRRPSPAGASADWAQITEDERIAAGEAAFLQFQTQIEELRAESSVAEMAAEDCFRYLPPGGLLALGEGGFRLEKLFRRFDLERVVVDAAFLRCKIRQTFCADPIDLDLAQVPGLRIYESSDQSWNYAAFVRQEESFYVGTPETPQERRDAEPARSQKDCCGSVAITLNVKDGRKLFPKDAKVEAYNEELGLSIVAKATTTREALAGRRNVSIASSSRFIIAKAPIGKNWRVRAVADSFYPAVSNPFTVSIDRTSRETLTLVPRRQVRPGRSKEKIERIPVPWGASDPRNPLIPKEPEGTTVNPAPQDIELGVPMDAWKWPWTEPEGYKPIPTPPYEEFVDPIIDIAVEFQNANPGAAISPGDPKIYMNTEYIPGARSESPNAYLVLGEGGAYTEVFLTDASTFLPEGTELAKLGRLDLAGYGEKLSGIDAAMLAAASTSYLKELGVDAEFADEVHANIRTGVSDAQNTPQILPSVTGSVDRKLREAGFTNLVDLANADEGELAEATGSALLGRRLISDARKFAPVEAWSPQAIGGLGLGESTLSELSAGGRKTVRSIGDIQRALASGSSDVLATLGGVDAAADLNNKLDDARDAASSRLESGKSLGATEFGLPESTVSKLAKRNVLTKRDLEDFKTSNPEEFNALLEDNAHRFGGPF